MVIIGPDGFGTPVFGINASLKPRIGVVFGFRYMCWKKYGSENSCCRSSFLILVMNVIDYSFITCTYMN